MLELLADVVVLQDVYDPKEHDHIVEFPGGLSHKLKLASGPSHSSFYSGWHVRPKSDAGPPKRTETLIFRSDRGLKRSAQNDSNLCEVIELKI